MYGPQLGFVICVALAGFFGVGMATCGACVLAILHDIKEAREKNPMYGPIMFVIAAGMCLLALGLGIAGAFKDKSNLLLGCFACLVIGLLFEVLGIILTIYYNLKLDDYIHRRVINLDDDTTSVCLILLQKYNECCGFTGVVDYLHGMDLLNVPNTCCNASAPNSAAADCVNKSDIFDVDNQTQKFYSNGCEEEIKNFIQTFGYINVAFGALAIIASCVAIYFVNKYKGTPLY